MKTDSCGLASPMAQDKRALMRRRGCWTSARIALSGVALTFLAAAPIAHAGAPVSEQAGVSVETDYKLGALDKIRVRVFEWRPSRDEVFEWAALNAEYTIGASGKLALPLIGDVLAAGLSTTDLAKAIGDRLKDRMGLVASPDASVEIIQFRPFYITGQIEKPGEYPYRPGITVLQALTISGGLQRGADLSHLRLEREIIASKGELDLMARERLSLLARRARLEAELKRADTVAYPAELEQKRKDASIATMLDQEDLIFEARRDGLETQIKALNQLKSFLEKEVESLTGQLATHNVQLNLMKQELETVSTLAEKGLTTAPRRMALERNVAALEGDRLRMETNLLRARQDISRTEISTIELHNKRISEATTELQQTQSKMEQIVERTETSEQLLYESEVITPRTLSDRARMRRVHPTFTIFRSTFGRVAELKADESTPVEPGDTIKVDMPLNGDGIAAEPDATSRSLGPRRFSQELLGRTRN